LRLYFRCSLIVLALLVAPLPASALLTNGNAAIDILGQFSTVGSDTPPSYTTGCVNNGVSALGFSNINVFSGLTIDSTNHWLFASDTNNNRLLIFPLNSSNQLSSKTPSYVFGPSTFTSCIQTNHVQPSGLVADPVNNWLYEAGTNGGPCEILLFNTSSMSNGEAASYHLGVSSCGVTQSKTNGPVGVALDQANQLLYVSDSNNNRVMVFPAYGNPNWTGNGENALYVLGQSTFTTGNANQGGSASQSSLNYPQGLAYDSVSQLLYVVDTSNNRVMVFPAYGNASWAGNGENALYALGQTNFTNSGENDNSNNGTTVWWDPSPIGVWYPARCRSRYHPSSALCQRDVRRAHHGFRHRFACHRRTRFFCDRPDEFLYESELGRGSG
jgi:DNA-binding beta-propeller fold protein YncE